MRRAAGSASQDQVMGDADLVSEILRRTFLPSSKVMIQFSAMNKSWQSAMRSPAVLRRFCHGKTPANLGFLVDFKTPPGDGRVVRLLYAHPSQGEESADALRTVINYSQYNSSLLSLDNIIGSHDGFLLTAVPEEWDQSSSAQASRFVYFTSCPSDRIRLYKPVACRIPEIPRHTRQHTVNTYGQFGFLCDAGNSGMSFFTKEPATIFDSMANGVSFRSTANVFVHVCIHEQGVWNRSVFGPIASAETVLFHRNPYSVIAGGKLNMMYIVGYILCLDIATKLWSKIELPSVENFNGRSCFDYTVAPISSGGIALVNYCKGKLNKWVLSHSLNSTDWTLESRLDLVQHFGATIPSCCWQRVFMCEEIAVVPDNYYAVQVRRASVNGRFVFLTFGFEESMYEVDMLIQNVREINNGLKEGPIGTIFPLSETWPPKF